MVNIKAQHKIISFLGCENMEISIKEFEKAVSLTGANILQTLEHNFEPQGKSILTLLSESHASLHSYPEHEFCYLDIFTCGDMKINEFSKEMQKLLKPDSVIEMFYDRSFRLIR
jgi:S-adenosylmethionine decarboxylase